MIRRLVYWLDDRLGGAPFLRGALRKIYPDHWSFFLGEFALYSFMTLVATGIWLALFYEPSSRRVPYDGAFLPYVGSDVSAAYASVLRICAGGTGSFIRAAHHWAAVIFVAAIVMHMSRVFFTAAFRAPRELNWVVGVILLTLASITGFTGYSLPDDTLSGTGLRIADSVLLAIPFIGNWGARALNGGAYGASALLPHLFFAHVFLLPELLIALISVHLAILWKQKHTNYPVPHATDDNVVGRRFWPDYALRSIAAAFGLAAIIAFLATFVPINPVWKYGSYRPWLVSSPAQPDWYAGWLDGALRLGPALAIRIGPHTIPAVFWPGVVMPGLAFALLAAWPWIDRMLSRDTGFHHVIALPSDAPWRTGAGVGLLTFALLLTLAGSDDIQAQALNTSVVALVWMYRLLLPLGSIAAGLVAAAIAAEVRRRRIEGPFERAVEITRTEEGGFEEHPPRSAQSL